MDLVGQLNACLSGHVSMRDMRNALELIRALPKDDPEMKESFRRKMQEAALYTIAFIDDIDEAKQLAQLALEPIYGAFGSKAR